jgi:hypothetical protein
MVGKDHFIAISQPSGVPLESTSPEGEGLFGTSALRTYGAAYPSRAA